MIGFTAFAAVAAMQLVVYSMTQYQNLTPDDDRNLAAELALSLQVHEMSIRTLEWTQISRIDLGLPIQTEQSDNLVFDERGRWFVSYDRESRDDAERFKRHGRLMYDGRTVQGYDDGADSGTIQEDSGWRKGGLSNDPWRGDELDGPGNKRLSERLLEATDLHMEKPSPRGLPVVGATAIIGDLVALLQVEIDPEHGFSPRTITIRDRAIRIPYYVYETTDFVLLDGVWLPQRCTLVGRMFKPSSEDAARLTACMRKRGVSRASDMTDARVQQEFLSALLEAFGVDEAPSEIFVPLREVVASYSSVNKPIPDSRFKLEFPPDYLIYDAIQGLVRKPGSSVWVENGR